MKFVIFAVFSLNLFAYGPVFVPVCDRTPQVKDAIVNRIKETKYLQDTDCTFADNVLNYVTYLDLSSKGITSLKVGDFSGLKSLWWLILSENNLSTLPYGLLVGLSSLREIDLSKNNLSTLPPGVFFGLSFFNFRKLSLLGNPLPRSEKDRIKKELPMAKIDF